MVVSDAVVQLVCSALVLALPVAVLVGAPPRDRGASIALVIVGLGAVGAVVLWSQLLDLSDDVAARILDGAIAAGLSIALATVLARSLGTLAGSCVTLLWTGGVLAPLLLATVGVTPALSSIALGAVDYGGVAATHVSVAAAVLGASAVTRRGRSNPVVATVGLSRARAGGISILTLIAASAWMLAVDRALSDASGRTLVNVVGACLLGGLAWWLMAVVVGRERPAWGLPFGIVLGWGSVGATAPFLSPVALVAAATLGTVAGAAVVLRGRPDVSPVARAGIATIVAVGVGGVVSALLADGFGLAATGSMAVVVAHLVTVLLVTATTFAVVAVMSAVLTVLFRWAIPDSN